MEETNLKNLPNNAETLRNSSKSPPNLQSKTQKARIYFGTSKFHHKFRAKRKKDREKEVFTLDSVFEACMNGKNCEILRNLSKKVELRFGHSVGLLTLLPVHLTSFLLRLTS